MKSQFYFFLKSYFGFTARESRGFSLILPMILILYTIPLIYNWVLKKRNQELYATYLIKADSLVQAGWKPYQSSFIAIGQEKADTIPKPTAYKRPNSAQLSKLDFADADSVVLQVVPGIGQVMAGRVIKFRDNVGGLHSKEQLLDVYGMTPEVMEKVFDYFLFKSEINNKLAINLLDANSLAKHPYINFGSAKVIVAYREQHGAYTTAEDLLQIKIFNEEWLERLKPYLDFRNQ